MSTTENIIYKYPLSSCNCYECNKHSHNNCKLSGIPSNMSVANCNFGGCLKSKLDCSGSISFNNKILPNNNENGYINLNPDIGPVLSRDFSKKTCKKDKKTTDIYTSKDPRLVDEIRGYTMTLDRPPYNSEVPLSETYDKKYRNYGKNYDDYSSIHSGQIMYYYDKSIQEPFFEPNFTLKSNVNSYLYKDPMDNYKPYYTHNNVNNFNPMKDSYPKEGCLSFIYDTTFHREDIMSKQMDLTNRTKYMSRWNL